MSINRLNSSRIVEPFAHWDKGTTNVTEPVQAPPTVNKLDGEAAADAGSLGVTSNNIKQSYSPNSTQVTSAQKQLNALGFNAGAEDGLTGPKTAAAVRAFQQANGLVVSGELDAATTSRLALRPVSIENSPIAPPPGAPGTYEAADAGSLGIPYTPVIGHAQVGKGNVGGEILDIQNKLSALGYDTGGADGVFGSKTVAAVRAFQAANNLTVDGIIGPQTHRFLDGLQNPNEIIDAGSLYVPDAPPPTLVSGHDRGLYMQSDDPTVVEEFDKDLRAYNDWTKDNVSSAYNNRVETLIRENGYDQSVAEDLAALEFKMSGVPAYQLPENAQTSNFATPLDGSDRRFNPAAFDEEFNAIEQLQTAIDATFSERFDARVDEVLEQKNVSREIAEHLVGMEFAAALQANGVPKQALPAGMSIDPTQVLVDNHEIFDKAHDNTSGLESDDQGWSFGRGWDTAIDVRDNFLGLDDPDGKVGLADLDAVINNQDDFDSEVVAAAITLREAAEGNEELRSYFDQPNFWQNLKDSPWVDPNSDSILVNLVRGPQGGGYSPEFMRRVVTEGPGVLRDIDNSLHQLSPEGQLETLFTDPDQALDNYGSFLHGVKDFAVDTGKLAGGAVAFSNPFLAAAAYKTTGTNVYAEAAGMVIGGGNSLVFNPDQLAKDVIGYDQFVDDPFRWAGNQAPDIILEIIGTKGAGKAARALRAADAAADAGHVGGKILPPSRELVDGMGAQYLRTDIIDGNTVNHLKLGDNHYEVITELADGSYDVVVRNDPPAPRSADFRSDAPPSPVDRPLPNGDGDFSPPPVDGPRPVDGDRIPERPTVGTRPDEQLQLFDDTAYIAPARNPDARTSSAVASDIASPPPPTSPVLSGASDSSPPVHEIEFSTLTNNTPKEFELHPDDSLQADLQDLEVKLNELTVEEAYRRVVKDDFARWESDISGHDGSYTDLLRVEAAQQTARDDYYQMLINDGFHEETIQLEMASVHATHEIDIIALGDPNEVSIGNGRVNSSIGSQWKGKRSDALKDYVRDLYRQGYRDQLLNVSISLNS